MKSHMTFLYHEFLITASYWKNIPGNGAQLTTPRRATSLVLTHLAGSAQINPSAVLACHDRAYPITYQVTLQERK